MDKKTCADGQKFDILVRACVAGNHQTRAEAAPLTGEWPRTGVEYVS